MPTELHILIFATPQGEYISSVKHPADIPEEISRLFGPSSNRIYTGLSVVHWKLNAKRDWHRARAYNWHV